VSTIADAGCRTVIVHARKAILEGLTPAQNRDIPPLDHARVHLLKRDFPSLEIVLNGGLDNAASTLSHLGAVDGVMIGRAAYRNPWLLAALEARLWGTEPPADGREVLERYEPYVRRELARGTRLFDIARHLHGLFSGCRGAARFRRALSELPRQRDAGIDALWEAAGLVAERTEALCSNG
jgi:tRNA-dihydrouridine synthase A